MSPSTAPDGCETRNVGSIAERHDFSTWSNAQLAEALNSRKMAGFSPVLDAKSVPLAEAEQRRRVEEITRPPSETVELVGYAGIAGANGNRHEIDVRLTVAPHVPFPDETKDLDGWVREMVRRAFRFQTDTGSSLS